MKFSNTVSHKNTYKIKGKTIDLTQSLTPFKRRVIYKELEKLTVRGVFYLGLIMESLVEQKNVAKQMSDKQQVSCRGLWAKSIQRNLRSGVFITNVHKS